MTDSDLKQKMLEAASSSYFRSGIDGQWATGVKTVEAIYPIVAGEIDRLEADCLEIVRQREGYLRIAQLNEERFKVAQKKLAEAVEIFRNIDVHYLDEEFINLFLDSIQARRIE